MRRIGLLGSGLMLGLVLAGCNKERNFFEFPDMPGYTDDGGNPSLDLSSAKLDGPTLAFDLLDSNDPMGPTITILSPVAGGEVQYDTLEVTAMIVAVNGSSIDAGSVELSIPAQQAGKLETATMSLTAVPNVYRGQLSIAYIPSGSSELSVSARDIVGRQSIATSTYLHDGGPVLTFVLPKDMTAKGSVNVELTVDDKLHPINDEAMVRVGVRSLGDVKLQIVPGSVPLRLTGVIDFSQYSPDLDGEQLIAAEATNVKGTVGRAQQGFLVDNLGPELSIVEPAAGVFIGGIVEIKATITDVSEVIDSSVIAVFANDPTFTVDLTRVGVTNAFSGQFDVRQLGKQVVLPTLSVRAQDKLGNESEIAEVIVVDNEPPGVSLDPPDVRMVKIVDGQRVCSVLFDPLGKGEFDPPDDGTIVKQVFSVRARIQDRGNRAPGLAEERPSLIVAGSVDLFAIAGNEGPLVVDTDGDGKCDSINPLLLPSTKATGPGEALSIRMTQIQPGGDADYPGALTESLAAGCNVMGEDGDSPGPLCSLGTTKMTVSISYAGGEPALWTIPPLAVGCLGLQLDTLNRLNEGPTCVAVRARDAAGNPGVSLPLRVCIDRGGGKCAGFNLGSAPNCTGTFNPLSNTVSQIPCLDAQPFQASGEIIF